MKKPIISLNDICFAYEGVVALRHVTLDIYRGETIVLQGDNGCGKSTLLKLLNGLIFPEVGTYQLHEMAITEKTLKNARFSKRFHQRIGFIFQDADVQLFCGSVEEEIQFGPVQMGLSETEIYRRTEDLLHLLNIEHLRKRAPYHLSGGEKRKVAIACILSMNPDVLVLDEPLAGLDQKSQVWLIDFLRQLHQAGKTLILSTHNEALAKLLADRLVYLNDNHEIESIVENKPNKATADCV